MTACAVRIMQIDTSDMSQAQKRDLDYSRPLDVHTWSDHSEVNAFVDEIYDAHFGGGNPSIQKKHIKVVLLDLYLAWCDDPKLNLSLSRDVNAYKPKSRYNAIHISKKTIEVVDRLIEAGLIHWAKGFLYRNTGIGRETRIWPTETLKEKFKLARFGPLDISSHPYRECVVLSDTDPETGETIEVEYEDNEQTNQMRELLSFYNKLLSRTYIDIPLLEKNYIDFDSDKKGRPRRLIINQKDKFVRRIFNRGSWNKGGRFWGGWWQRCPKAWRRFDPEARQPGIFIDDKPTSELDYSGMHIVMLYAKAGIDYWADIGEDTYTIELPELGFEPEQLRSICKQLVLVALNAKTDDATYKAFRSEAETGSPLKSLKDDQLKSILDKLREKHAPIADTFATDQGIDLMRKDSNITERIIKHFTDQQIPILTIHDSYIIWDGYEDELDRVMKEAFEAEMKVSGVRIKQENKTSGEILDEHFARRAMDIRNPAFRTELEYAREQRINPPRTDRYRYHYEQFQEWLSRDTEAQADG